MIAVEDLHVHAGGKAILRGVDLEVRPGRVTALLGANGAGKSTLLRVVCGDVESRGLIRFEGRPMASWSRAAQARRRAVMLQESSLSFPFSALEVVLMGRAPHLDGRETRRDRDIARAALGCMQAEPLAGRLYPTLSGGEKQRVQLARALAQVWDAPEGAPRYLLLDEPTANLDPRHQHLALTRIRGFAAEGGAVLVIVHDLNLAAQYADDVVLLKHGKVVAHGTAVETLTEANLAVTFDLPLRILCVPALDWPLIYSGGGNDDASEPEPH